MVDYFYEYDTDRETYPFRPFSKWARYDFEKWMHRAQNDVDRKKAPKAARDESRHRVTSRPKARIAPDQETRHRDAVSRGHSVDMSGGRSSNLAEIGQAAKQLRAIGLRELSDSLVRSNANPEPATIDEALTAMPDGFRATLLPPRITATARPAAKRSRPGRYGMNYCRRTYDKMRNSRSRRGSASTHEPRTPTSLAASSTSS